MCVCARSRRSLQLEKMEVGLSICEKQKPDSGCTVMLLETPLITSFLPSTLSVPRYWIKQG